MRLPGRRRAFSDICTTRANYTAYGNASVKYFPLGEDKFKELVLSAERARDFIFLEYFIS